MSVYVGKLDVEDVGQLELFALMPLVKEPETGKIIAPFWKYAEGIPLLILRAKDAPANRLGLTQKDIEKLAKQFYDDEAGLFKPLALASLVRRYQQFYKSLPPEELAKDVNRLREVVDKAVEKTRDKNQLQKKLSETRNQLKQVSKNLQAKQLEASKTEESKPARIVRASSSSKAGSKETIKAAAKGTATPPTAKGTTVDLRGAVAGLRTYLAPSRPLVTYPAMLNIGKTSLPVYAMRVTRESMAEAWFAT